MGGHSSHLLRLGSKLFPTAHIHHFGVGSRYVSPATFGCLLKPRRRADVVYKGRAVAVFIRLRECVRPNLQGQRVSLLHIQDIQSVFY
jgi:hypothetical protein